jgi:GH25 family lysozyme M1 (1,4-beta-N-acetylmuramidase)
MNEFVVAEEEKMKPIVDISYWQNPDLIDYDKFANGISGANLRGAYGIWKDKHFDRHYQELYSRGVPLGSYHYIIGNYTGLAQADIFNQAISGKELKLGLWNDVEDRSPTTGLFASIVNEYHSNIELLAKRKVGIYTGVYAWSEIMAGDSKRYSDRALWLAHYGVTNPSLPRYGGWTNWNLWQWSSSGRIDGYLYNVDMNVFNGTETEYRKYFNLGEIIPEPSQPEPPIVEVIMPELKVIRNTNIRSEPNTSGAVLGYYVAGNIVKVLDIHVNSNISVWVKTDKGWSAVVHGLIKYME